MSAKINNNSFKAKQWAISLIHEHLHVDKRNIKSIILQTNGWTNKIFLFKLVNNQKYIVRIAANDKLIDRQCEIQILKLLKKFNNYDFVFIDNKTGNYIKKYIEGRVVNKSDSKNPDFLKLLAKKIKKLHSIKINKNCHIKVNDNHQYDDYKNHIDTKYQDMYNHLLNKHENLKRCICHHDLTPWNIIYNPKKHQLSLIDFEWSRINSPYFDLANFIRESKIHNTKYEKIFLSAYDKKIQETIITDYLYICSYFSFLWTYSIKAYKNILLYRTKNLQLVKKYYQEIKQRNK